MASDEKLQKYAKARTFYIHRKPMSICFLQESVGFQCKQGEKKQTFRDNEIDSDVDICGTYCYNDL